MRTSRHREITRSYADGRQSLGNANGGNGAIEQLDETFTACINRCSVGRFIELFRYLRHRCGYRSKSRLKPDS